MLPCRWTPLSWSGPLNLPFSCVPDSFFSLPVTFSPLPLSSPPPLIFLRPPPFTPSIHPPPAASSRFRPQCSAPYIRRCQAFISTLAHSTPSPFNLRRLCILSNNSYTVLRTFTIPFFYQRKSCLFLEHVL